MAHRIDKPDTTADLELRKLLDNKRSFIVIAGAGSGKTTSLIKALDYISKVRGEDFLKNRKRIACITYTTGAVEEILSDVKHNPLFHVSTIHSFLWEIISSFQVDIKSWVIAKITENLIELEETRKNYGARVQQRTKDKNLRDTEAYQNQLTEINKVDSFTYETGSDYLNGILGHSDIIKMVPQLINEKPLLRAVISQRYPYVFVDESQDTIPQFLESLKNVDKEFPNDFCLGFFGDPMQKIYLTGAGSVILEDGWAIVKKPENFRCPIEVLNLINKIRRDVDSFQQIGGRKSFVKGKLQSIQGCAQLVVLPSDENRNYNLSLVRKYLAKKHDDKAWILEPEERTYKILMIEHRMTANRLKFTELFSAFKDNGSEKLSAAFTEGQPWPLQTLKDIILPLINALDSNKDFDVIELLRRHSPRLAKDHIQGLKTNFETHLLSIRSDVEILQEKVNNAESIRAVLTFVSDRKLFLLDQRWVAYFSGIGAVSENADEVDSTMQVLNALIDCPANQLKGYVKYLQDESPYSTQHSVKGAEFDRVLVILDDDEGKNSSLYSYEKYFKLKALSDTDNENIKNGKDSVLDRTRRLFYVCCSRAMKDLAVVLFVEDVSTALSVIPKLELFAPDCIIDGRKLSEGYS